MKQERYKKVKPTDENSKLLLVYSLIYVRNNKLIKVAQNWRTSLGIRKSKITGFFSNIYWGFFSIVCNKIYVLYNLVTVTQTFLIPVSCL